MCLLKHVAKVNQKSNLNLFSECVDSSDLLASFLVFLFLHRLEVPVICQHLLTSGLSIEFATIFKIHKTLDIYLQVPVVSGLILDCRFQVLNLPGRWCKKLIHSRSCWLWCLFGKIASFLSNFLFTYHTSFSHPLSPSPGFLQSPKEKYFFQMLKITPIRNIYRVGSYVCSTKFQG